MPAHEGQGPAGAPSALGAGERGAALPPAFLFAGIGPGAASEVGQGQGRASHRGDDVLGLESDVLDPRAPVVVHVFLREGNQDTPVTGPVPTGALTPLPCVLLPRAGPTWIWDFFLPGAGSLMGILMDSS